MVEKTTPWIWIGLTLILIVVLLYAGCTKCTIYFKRKLIWFSTVFCTMIVYSCYWFINSVFLMFQMSVHCAVLALAVSACLVSQVYSQGKATVQKHKLKSRIFWGGWFFSQKIQKGSKMHVPKRIYYKAMVFEFSQMLQCIIMIL